MDTMVILTVIMFFAGLIQSKYMEKVDHVLQGNQRLCENKAVR
ncbi:MAG: hypothetical protein SCH66_02090 [Methanolobus sp.]|nr:hypothetical protein [Methanolobus sp.]